MILSKAGPLTLSDLQRLPPDEWLLRSFVFFRDLGFFTGFADTDTQTACERILAERGRPFNPRSPLVDMRLLSYDPYAYWRGPMEDCGSEAGYYASALGAWSLISRGVFVPTEIVEDFGPAEGKPTLVWFRHQGTRYVVLADHTPHSQWGDWLDLTVIDQLNIILDKEPRQYTLFKQPFNDACLFCLTDEERRVLIRERGWRFLFDEDDDESEDEFLARFGLA